MENEKEEKPVSRPLSVSSTFSVSVTGQIEKVYFPSFDHVYCKYSFSYGTDWSVVAGDEEGITQVSKRAVFPPENSSQDVEGTIHWNHPVEIAFSTSNPFGWPQIVCSVYGLNAYGSDVIRGYGAIHIPATPGTHCLTVALFTPEASSLLGRFRAVISGNKPEFVDAKVAAQAEGRGVLTVHSQGLLTLKLTVVFRDFGKQGYRYTS